MSETESVFSKLSDDVIINIFFKLEDDPRNWARLSCVSTKFSSLIHDCSKIKCSETMPAIVSDFLSAAPPGGWASFYKLAVCCPGLIHSGVLPENSDWHFENYPRNLSQLGQAGLTASSSNADNSESAVSGSDYCWPLFGNLSLHTTYNDPGSSQARPVKGLCSRRTHVASRVWDLSRDQGNKLLSSRYRGDCLYLCNWPGCIHFGERRNYMLFRGIFKDFKHSKVWRTVNDRRNKHRINLSCAFCASKRSWNLHSALCLRRYFGNHSDGEPVIRAYVCENGHVSGAWTDWPSYT